jgi:prepilin-type N-terminal cleavage/methylation domain-containing protein
MTITYGQDRVSFTLIELLVVVAVIAILASIATPNLLLSHTRSKVARSKSEMRTLSIGIESYASDQNAYPRMAHWRFYGDPAFDIILGEKVQGVLSTALSTPICYVGNPHVLDVFMKSRGDLPLDERMYTYQVPPVYRERRPTSAFWPLAVDFYGSWRMASVGPDLTFDQGFPNSAQLPYDPTNGTVSSGNIWFSQKQPEGLAPIPGLLGPH